MRNNHANFANPMETLLRCEFGFKDRPSGTVFDADRIVKDFFYDAMCLILCKKEIEDWEKFADKYASIQGVHMGNIENIEEIYNEFRSLMKS